MGVNAMRSEWKLKIRTKLFLMSFLMIIFTDVIICTVILIIVSERFNKQTEDALEQALIGFASIIENYKMVSVKYSSPSKKK